jgi:hypothetical protein
MAKKPADPDTAADEDLAAAISEVVPSLEVPPEVVEALGGQPIPPPPMPSSRVSVRRVGEAAAKPSRDGRGLLAPTRPDRREALRKIDQGREALARLVLAIDGVLPQARAAVVAATLDGDACAAEEFDGARALRLLDAIEGALDKHLG